MNLPKPDNSSDVRLLYIANARLPTEKAHGVRIVKMCEAFAQSGAKVELVVPFRLQTARMRRVRNWWAHYGMRPGKCKYLTSPVCGG